MIEDDILFRVSIQTLFDFPFKCSLILDSNQKLLKRSIMIHIFVMESLGTLREKLLLMHATDSIYLCNFLTLVTK